MTSYRASSVHLPSREGRADRLFILLHGVGGSAVGLEPLGAFQKHFPSAAVDIPEGFSDFDLGASGRQWFSVRGVTEQNRPQRVAAALPLLETRIREAQQRHGVSQADTILVGFSQGAIMALELAVARDGLVGVVEAFAGRFASLPAAAPNLTKIHLFHGEQDAVMSLALVREAYEHLRALSSHVTLDTEAGLGHELSESLVNKAMERLRTLHWQSK